LSLLVVDTRHLGRTARRIHECLLGHPARSLITIPNELSRSTEWLKELQLTNSSTDSTDGGNCFRFSTGTNEGPLGRLFLELYNSGYRLYQRLKFTFMNQDCSFGIATGWAVGVRFPDRGNRFVASPHRPDRLWRPPCLLSNGCRGSSRGLKRTGRETNYSLSSSAGFKAERYVHCRICLHRLILN
jgi:hypothetical protein